MSLRRLYELMFRPWPPIGDRAALADFIDEQSAFVTQKGIYEYSRARAGHYAKVLFSEPEFVEAVDQARWRAYPLGLAMVAEIVEGVLLPHSAIGRSQQLDALRGLVLSVFDRYPTPAALGEQSWSEARADLERRLPLIGLHPPKRAMDVPKPFAKAYFDLMPIHKSLRGRDFSTTHNYLKVTMCNIHDELTRRIDASALAKSMQKAEIDGAPAGHR